MSSSWSRLTLGPSRIKLSSEFNRTPNEILKSQLVELIVNISTNPIFWKTQVTSVRFLLFLRLLKKGSNIYQACDLRILLHFYKCVAVGGGQDWLDEEQHLVRFLQGLLPVFKYIIYILVYYNLINPIIPPSLILMEENDRFSSIGESFLPKDSNCLSKSSGVSTDFLQAWSFAIDSESFGRFSSKCFLMTSLKTHSWFGMVKPWVPTNKMRALKIENKIILLQLICNWELVKWFHAYNCGHSHS